MGYELERTVTKAQACILAQMHKCNGGSKGASESLAVKKKFNCPNGEKEEIVNGLQGEGSKQGRPGKQGAEHSKIKMTGWIFAGRVYVCVCVVVVGEEEGCCRRSGNGERKPRRQAGRRINAARTSGTTPTKKKKKNTAYPSLFCVCVRAGAKPTTSDFPRSVTPAGGRERTKAAFIFPAFPVFT